MKKTILKLIPALLIILSLFLMKASAEEIKFDNETFVLKRCENSPDTKGWLNEYFKQCETPENWTKMIGIYSYPEEKCPLKFANKVDRDVEASKTSTLIKFIENKKGKKAIISYLEIKTLDDKKYVEYIIRKFEKNPVKGMTELKYVVKHYFTSEAELTQIGNKIREDHDKYLKMFADTPVPSVIEKEMN